MTEDKRDPGQLPDLPDLPDLPELPELDELEPLPPEPEPVKATPKPAPKPEPKPEPVRKPEPKVAPVAAASVTPIAKQETPVETPSEDPQTSEAPATAAKEAPAPVLDADGRPPLRKLEKAVLHLRLAAQIVLVGALMPFMLAEKAPEAGYASGSLWFSFAAKLVGLLGAFVLYKQVSHNWGPKLPGLVGKLADTGLIPKPKEDEKPKRKAKSKRNPEATTLEHPFPTLLHVVGSLIMLAAIGLAIEDPRSGRVGSVGLVEYAMFIWAALTYVHIASYERWGKFNPLFALLFLGMLLVGLSSVFVALDNTGALKIAGILGGLLVGGGGGLAAFTIVEAMMQAKKEGDIKKAAAIEARKAARKSSRKK